MTWAIVAIIVLALGAAGYFIYVGKIFRERKYLEEEENKNQARERLSQESKAKQEQREIRHEERLREIDRARDNPADYERLLNSWPDATEDSPPGSTGVGMGGNPRGDMH